MNQRRVVPVAVRVKRSGVQLPAIRRNTNELDAAAARSPHACVSDGIVARRQLDPDWIAPPGRRRGDGGRVWACHSSAPQAHEQYHAQRIANGVAVGSASYMP
jgi:hypothetical protein